MICIILSVTYSQVVPQSNNVTINVDAKNRGLSKFLTDRRYPDFSIRKTHCNIDGVGIRELKSDLLRERVISDNLAPKVLKLDADGNSKR
jgi:hypothetical protein